MSKTCIITNFPLFDLSKALPSFLSDNHKKQSQFSAVFYQNKRIGSAGGGII
jgi:hypothetical protein